MRLTVFATEHININIHCLDNISAFDTKLKILEFQATDCMLQAKSIHDEIVSWPNICKNNSLNKPLRNFNRLSITY